MKTILMQDRRRTNVHHVEQEIDEFIIVMVMFKPKLMELVIIFKIYVTFCFGM